MAADNIAALLNRPQVASSGVMQQFDNPYAMPMNNTVQPAIPQATQAPFASQDQYAQAQMPQQQAQLPFQPMQQQAQQPMQDRRIPFNYAYGLGGAGGWG